MKNIDINAILDKAIHDFIIKRSEFSNEIQFSLCSRNIPQGLEDLIKQELNSQRKKEKVGEIKRLYHKQQVEQQCLLEGRTLDEVVADLKVKKGELSLLNKQYNNLVSTQEYMQNHYNLSTPVDSNPFYSAIRTHNNDYYPIRRQYYNLAADIKTFPNFRPELFRLLNSMYFFIGEIGIFYSNDEVIQSDNWATKINELMAKLYWANKLKQLTPKINSEQIAIAKLQDKITVLEHILSRGRPTNDYKEMKKMLTANNLKIYRKAEELFKEYYDFDLLGNTVKARVFSSLMQWLRPHIETEEQFTLGLKQFDKDEVTKITPLETQKKAIMNVLNLKNMSLNSDDDKEKDRISRLDNLRTLIYNVWIRPNTTSNEFSDIISTWCNKVLHGTRNLDAFKSSSWAKFFPCVPHADDAFIKQCFNIASNQPLPAQEELQGEDDAVVMRNV